MRRLFQKVLSTSGKPRQAGPEGSQSVNQRRYSLSQLPVLDGTSLLSEVGYDPKLTPLFRLVGLGEKHFEQLYREPVLRFAEAVQLAPASENNHHCGPGGLLQHTLETIDYALQLRRSYQLPLGATPQTIAAQEHIWTYAIFCGCLLHDIGKVLGRFEILLQLPKGQTRVWTPHAGPIKSFGAEHYSIEFRSMPYKAHQRLGMTLYSHIIPQAGRAWLMQHQDIMAQLTSYIWGDEYDSQIIGEIALRADRESTARNLDITQPDRRLPGASASLADRLMRALRQLLAGGELKTNRDGAQAWVAGETTYLVCRPVIERVIKQLETDGIKGIPQDPVRLYDVLQEHGFAMPTAQGGAIHRVKVDAEAFSHVFTCLKMPTRRLWVPHRLPQSLQGTIEELSPQDTPAQAGAAAPPGTAPESTPEPESAPENPTKGGTVEPESQSIETETAASEPEDPFAEPESAPPPPPPVVTAARMAPKSPPSQPRDSQELPKPAATATLGPYSWEDDVGNLFFEWIKQGLSNKTLDVNNAKAGIHFVEDGIFLVSPRIFQQFCVAAGLGPKASYTKLQKRFQRLKINKKTRMTHMNVHTYRVKTASTTTRLNGWMIPYERVFPEGAERPAVNTLLHPEDGEVESDAE